MTPTDDARTAAGVRKVGLNAASLLAAYILPRLFTVGAVVLAARVLGAAEFGEYGTAAAFAVILSVLSSLGMLPLLVRDIARDPAAAPRLVRAAHVIKAGAGLAMMLAAFLITRMLGYSNAVTAASMFLLLGYWLGAHADNLMGYFQGVERMRVCTEATALGGLVAGGLGAAVIVLTDSLVWFAVCVALGQLTVLTWLLVRAPADVRFGSGGSFADVRALARALLPFAAAFIALAVYYKIEILFLRELAGSLEVGLYTAAYKFADIFQALVVVATAAVLPKLARAASELRSAPAAPRWAATRTTELLLILTVPAAGALWLARVEALGIFGADYVGAAASLAWLAPALPALALNVHTGYVLGTAQRVGWMALLYAGAWIVKVAIVFVSVPRFGAAGAAGAVFVAESALAVGSVVALGRLAGAAPHRRPVLLAAGAALGAGLIAVVPPDINGLLQAALYGVVVLVGYALGGALSEREVQAIIAALPRRRSVDRDLLDATAESLP